MVIDGGKIRHMLDLINRQYPGWKGFADERFIKDEISYKKKAVEKAKSLLSESELKKLIDEARYDDFINRLEKVGKSTNLLYITYKSGDMRVLYVNNLDKPLFCSKIMDLLHGKGNAEERLGRYSEYLKSFNMGSSLTITFPTYLLFLLYPETEIFYKPTLMKWLWKNIHGSEPLDDSEIRNAYRAIKTIVYELKEGLYQFSPKDMVDVQSFIWVCNAMDKGPKNIEYWKIIPGIEGEGWEKCRDGGYIQIAWGGLGDISGLSREDFEKRCKEAMAKYPDYAQISLEQIWNFAHIP
jgi:hypothetical protein